MTSRHRSPSFKKKGTVTQLLVVEIIHCNLFALAFLSIDVIVLTESISSSRWVTYLPVNAEQTFKIYICFRWKYEVCQNKLNQTKNFVSCTFNAYSITDRCN